MGKLIIGTIIICGGLGWSFLSSQESKKSVAAITTSTYNSQSCAADCVLAVKNSSISFLQKKTYCVCSCAKIAANPGFISEKAFDAELNECVKIANLSAANTTAAHVSPKILPSVIISPDGSEFIENPLIQNNYDSTTIYDNGNWASTCANGSCFGIQGKSGPRDHYVSPSKNGNGGYYRSHK